MELLRPDDLKNELLKRSAQQREELEEEAKLLADRTQKILTNALIIGGAMALTYFLVRQLSSSKSEPKVKTKKVRLVQQEPEEEEPAHESRLEGIMSRVGSAVTGQITAFLLTLAKEKLIEYLQAHAEKKIEKEQ